MVQDMDTAWLYGVCDDSKTQTVVKEILDLRNKSIKTNVILENGPPFSLNILDLKLNVPREYSIAVIELLEESFRRNDHFKHPSFVPSAEDIVLDIGANCGVYALHCRYRQPNCRIICCEPVPKTFQVLGDNLKLNNAADIVVMKTALGNYTGEISLDVSPNFPSLNGVMLKAHSRSWMKAEWMEKIMVPVSTVEDIAEKNNIQQIDILKIDVEGAEMEVLEGAEPVLCNVDKIVIEYHNQDLKNRIIDFCLRYDFMCVMTDDSGSYYGDLYFMRGI